MEYIKSLGFDSIWLSPIFAVGSMALGDDVTDFKKYNPELGTDEQFQAFFEAVSGMGELDLVLCPYGMASIFFDRDTNPYYLCLLQKINFMLKHKVNQ